MQIFKSISTNQKLHFDQNDFFPQFCYDINQRKNTSPFDFFKFCFFQPYLVSIVHNHQSAGVLREGERRIYSVGCRTGFSMHVNIILLIIILILVHHFSFGDLVVLLMLLKCYTEQRWRGQHLFEGIQMYPVEVGCKIKNHKVDKT